MQHLMKKYAISETTLTDTQEICGKTLIRCRVNGLFFSGVL